MQAGKMQNHDRAIADTLARAEAWHEAGRLSEAETLYRSILRAEPEHARALHNLGAIALRTGHPDAAADLFDRACKRDPAMAEAFSNLGLALAQQGRRAEARSALNEAVRLRPDFAEAWSNLGIFDRDDGSVETAVDHLRRAAALAPHRGEIAVNLGAALVEYGSLAEAIDIFERELARGGASAALHFNLGKARFLAGAIQEAIVCFRRAIAIEPEFPDAHHTLAHALLCAGDLAEGWREYDWRWRAKRFHVPPRDFDLPHWDGADLAGRRVLVWSEQGLGDKLLFAGLLPELVRAGAAVTVEIEPRLVELFRRSFLGIDVVARTDPTDLSNVCTRFDLQVPLGDLPRYLRPTLDGFRPLGAYLLPDAGKVQALRDRYRVQGKALVGIAWASRPPKGLPLDAFAPLLTRPDVRWVSLQYGDHAAEIAAFVAEFGADLVHDTTVDALADFDTSLAQTAALDAVVTIQNATLYTAAGLGLPTFALSAPEPDWRWLGCDRSPWHDTVRLYRQDRIGLERALENLSAGLADWLAHFPR